MIKAAEIALSGIILGLLESILPILNQGFINHYLFPSGNSNSENRNLGNTSYEANEIFKRDLFECIDEAIEEFGLPLTRSEYYHIILELSSSFNALELNSIFNGVLNGQLFNTIQQIIISIVGPNMFQEDEYVTLITAGS